MELSWELSARHYRGFAPNFAPDPMEPLPDPKTHFKNEAKYPTWGSAAWAEPLCNPSYVPLKGYHRNPPHQSGSPVTPSPMIVDLLSL